MLKNRVIKACSTYTIFDYIVKDPIFIPDQNDFLSFRKRPIVKRIEAIIPSNRLNLVVSAIEDVGVSGVTIVDSKGRGSGVRPSLRSLRGTSKQQAEYNSLAFVITIVEDEKVDKIVDAIVNVASTGSSGDGVIFVSHVDYTVDIQTKHKKGSS
jgi:nitrogen regulatory protein P-II 1